MNDPLLMSVLDRQTNRDEQRQPLPEIQPVLAAERRQRNPGDQFHHKIRLPRRGRPGIEDTRDLRMVHHRQGLPLGLETSDHFRRIHPGFDQLQSHPPPHRMLLFGDINLPESPFADRFHQAIMADDPPNALGVSSPAARRSVVQIENLCRQSQLAA